MLPPPEASLDEVDSGIGKAPDSDAKTRIAGSQATTPAPPAPAIAPVLAPRPAGNMALAIAPTPPAGVKQIKQTILGTAPVPAAAAVAQAATQPRPTAAETKAQDTIPGTAVHGAQRFVPLGDLAPGTTVGEYRIDAKIGEGGMGTVYSATHPMIGKRAAIKVLSADLGTDPVLVQRFVQEARSVNQIGHPNIVDVFAFGKLADGRNYFVMEYLQGESLRDRLRRSFMSISEAVQILDEVASALDAAHEKHIVHRDLKPDNVYLASVRGGLLLVKLLDFGIAKLSGDSGIAKTSTGEMMGTPAYLSPEQARGKNVDYRTDIYALGCMFYEMITGRFVFMAESSADMIVAHLSETPTKPSVYKADIPPLLEQLILQMIDKDPARRPTLLHIRNVFAELVASGMVPIEAGSTGMFRSDLARRRGESELRTPRSSGNVLAPASGEMPTRARSTSEAPTAINFTPGPDVLVPSDENLTSFHASQVPRSRTRGVVIALLILLVGVGGGIAAISALKSKDAQKTVSSPIAASSADASIVAVASPDAALQAAADAQSASPVAPAEPTKRSIEVRLTVPTATVEIDGAVVDASGGVARADLADGEHLVVAKAAGYVTTTKTVAVAADHTSFVITLERARRPSPRTTQTAKGSAAKGSASPPNGRDGTLDPFAD